MRKLRVYLDTSIINFAIAEDIPIENKERTLTLCDEINKGKYEGFISEVVLREVNNTKDERKRKNLVNFIEKLKLGSILKVNDEVNKLAHSYIKEKIIPATYEDDALHIALTTLNEVDILVSWNFKHLVRHKTRVDVARINIGSGYKNIDICTPWEVVEDV
jgi:rRNA-processing protein FCF1